ncbi:MAG: FadR/GntR family transcriptional regulator [Nannocystales bacterium]
MGLQKIDRRTISDQVFEQLSREIVDGRMEPGVLLPSERELVQVLGVNRGAVREALKRLAQSGLVQIQQGGGTRVLDYRKTAGLDLLGSLMIRADGEIDVRVARSVMEMRSALAPDVARLAATRRDDATVQQLAALVTAMGGTEDLGVLQSHSLEFWDVLVRAADNVAYRLSFNTLRDTYELIRGALVVIMADEVSDVGGHRDVLDAVQAEDGDAARAAAEALVQRGTARVFDLLEALAAEQESPHTNLTDASASSEGPLS